jgi:hypothetical protein
MDTRRSFHRPVSIWFYLLLAGFVLILLVGCGETTLSKPTTTSRYSSTNTPELPTFTPGATQPPLPTQTPACTDNLTFVDDATIPDGTIVAPGSSLDKQWLVQNSGTCNWDTRYRLRLVSDEALGASLEQALFPARAGTQANLRILFIAPQEAGEYVSEWQAFDANGIPFGESFYIKIEVQQ